MIMLIIKSGLLWTPAGRMNNRRLRCYDHVDYKKWTVTDPAGRTNKMRRRCYDHVDYKKWTVTDPDWTNEQQATEML